MGGRSFAHRGEWENACRGPDGRIYPWGNDPPSRALANYGLNDGTTTDVSSYPPGASGLYDFAGNVWEWTSSTYGSYPYDANDGRENPEGDALRTVRGGSWVNPGGNIRCASRLARSPGAGTTPSVFGS